MKKLLWIFGIVMVVVLVALVSVPFFVDVDRYRPLVVAEANKRINGRLELGRLSLGLWGAIRIHAESIRLSARGFPEPILDTKQFRIDIPYSSVLGGAPQLTAVLEAPRVLIRKNRDGTMNLLELLRTAAGPAEPARRAEASPAPADDQLRIADSAVAKKKKPAEETAAAPSAPPPGAPERVPEAPPGSAPAASPQVPKLIAGARLGLRIEKARLDYIDDQSRATYRMEGLDLEGKNLGLGSDMELALRAPLAGESPLFRFNGPVQLDARLKPLLSGGSVRSVSGRIRLDASALAVELRNGSFRKSAEMPLLLQAQFEGTDRETLLRGLDLDFHGFKLHGKGRVTTVPMAAKLDISSDPGTIRLEKLESFAPPAKAYQLKGLAELSLGVDWKPEQLRLNGDVKVSDGGFFHKEFFQAPLGFRLQAGFSENALTISRASLSGPESELDLSGSVKNFLAPQFSVAISGKSLNIDRTLQLSPPKASAWALLPPAYAAPPEENPLMALAKNPVAAGAAGTLTLQLARLTVYGALLESVSAKASLQNLLLRVPEASLRSFGGSVKANGEADLRSAGLSFRTSGTVSGISAKDAFSTYFPKYKNTLEGTVDASWSVGGAAFPAATRIRSVNGTVKIAARDGAVKSVDVQESINGAIAKIPFLKNQKPVKIDNGFRSLTADVKIEHGTVKADPIEIHPRSQGFVVKGRSLILESLQQETFLDVFDPQGQLPKELNPGPGKPAIPLRIAGLLTSPQTDYEYTLKRVGTTAGTNVLKDQALKALGVDNAPGRSDQDKLKEAADKLRKKFGF